MQKIANTEYNVFAYVQTPWHVLGVEASMLYLQAHGVDVKGIVNIYEHPTAGFLVKESDFVTNLAEVYFPSTPPICVDTKCNRSKLYRIVLNRLRHFSIYTHVLFGGWFSRKENPLYVLGLVHPNTLSGWEFANLGRDILYVTIDEGVGTYLGTYSIEKPRVRSFKDIILYSRYFRDEIIYHKWVRTCHKVLDLHAFKLENGRIVANKELMPFYEQVMQKRAERLSISMPDDFDCSILVCTSVLSEVGDEKQDVAEMKLLNQLFDALKSNKLKAYIKPHPRDKYYVNFAGKWGCELLTSSVALEVLCAIKRPKCIVGFGSTALLTAKAFYGIPVLCITDMLERDWVGDYSKKANSRYKERFGHLVDFPQDMGQLINRIKEL